MIYDKIIIGAGFYGLYAARFCAERGQRVLVLERESAPFRRATYINQARVHMGYHYPRSYTTATKSANYFDRFVKDFSHCIVDDFEQVYATSAAYSWTDARRFKRFCANADIPCRELACEQYFKPGRCSGAFLTREYAYDAAELRDRLLLELEQSGSVEIRYGAPVTALERGADRYRVTAAGEAFEAPFVLVAAYASCNELLALAGLTTFKIKYELCEIILCETCEALKGVGITVMDGPFFSIMPFGHTGLHSLTSVSFTPHVTSYEALPTFSCQRRSGGFCSPESLGNCDDCPARPATAYPYMGSLARKYLLDRYKFSYKTSLFSMKPILKASELDDSRPTLIRRFTEGPDLVGVLSGKINTVYDLDEVLV